MSKSRSPRTPRPSSDELRGEPFDALHPWNSDTIAKAYEMITRQLEQFQVKFARIVTPTGFEPKEVWIVWETLKDDPIWRRHIATRGLLTENNTFLSLGSESGGDWKYLTYTMSDDCQYVVFVSESLEMGHRRDVIQFEDVLTHTAKFVLVLDRDEFHGPLFVGGPMFHFKISSGKTNRKLLYFAKPTHEQMTTKNGKNRLFVMCIYHFDLKKISVVTDERLCEKPINAIEWTPDQKGVVLHRDNDLLWYRFGEAYVNVIYPNCPAPLKISFSPLKDRLAVFLPTGHQCNNSIILFHWPFVKAAAVFKHDVSDLDEYRIWSVPERPWALGGTYLVFNANWQHNVVSYSLEVATNKLEKFSFPKPAVIVDVQDKEMLFETVSANSYSRLWISNLASVSKETEFVASLLASQPPQNRDIHNFDVEHLYFSNNAYTGLLFTSEDHFKNGRKLPLIVAPYAGEKPNFTNLSLDPAFSTLVNFGYCVLVVNPRKTPTDFEDGLPKELDTEVADDIHNAVLATIESHKHRIDPSQICLYGAKYGSFIVSTMLVKFPEFYHSGALIHPALDYPKQEDPEKIEYLQKFQALQNPTSIKVPIIMIYKNVEHKREAAFTNALIESGGICVEEDDYSDEEEIDFLMKVSSFYENPSFHLNNDPEEESSSSS